MPAKDPKKRTVVGSDEPTAARPHASEVSAAELRAQIAILAEQVRRLGDRVGHTEDPPPVGSVAVQLPPAAEPLAPAHTHVVSLAEPRLPPPATAQRRAEPDTPAAQAQEPIAARTARLFAGVIAMAEQAASEIRDSAEREAARIRARAGGDRSAPDLAAEDRQTPQLAAPAPGLVNVLERQLAALAAGGERIERATASLRAQTRALDAERQRLHDAISAARRSQ